VTAPHPENEQDRVDALRRDGILATDREAPFDDPVQLPSQVCQVPTDHAERATRPTPKQAPAQPPLSQPFPRNILLVEDMEDNRVLVTVLLKALPYRLDLAEQGAAGVEKFQSGQYDLVLMDIQMPIMDGYEAVRVMRVWEQEQQRGETPIIALTGNSLEEDIGKAKTSGFTAYVTKPLKKNTLLEVIQRYTVTSSGKESAKSGCEAGPVVVLVDSAFEPLIPTFMANRNKDITIMTDAIATRDFETIKQVAHGMKGVSGSYGFHAMTTIAGRVEQAAKAADEASIRQDLVALASYLTQVEIAYE
jgi:CheY-like chemotaxis protein/HPt (histidine-containing phosphotransfer) domain-containing protein